MQLVVVRRKPKEKGREPPNATWRRKQIVLTQHTSVLGLSELAQKGVHFKARNMRRRSGAWRGERADGRMNSTVLDFKEFTSAGGDGHDPC